MNITDKIKQSFKGNPCGIVYYYIYNQNNIPALQHRSMHISSIDDDVKTIESMKSFIIFAVDNVVIHFVISEDGDTEYSILNGFVKWDGCMETHGGYHTCSLQDIESIHQFLIQIYRKAYEMLEDKVDPSGFGF